LQLIEFTKKGFYCPQGDFYIDPWRPVKNALITHAHSDHARYGHKYYLSHHDSIPVMQLRLGNNHYEGVDFGEVRNINGVNVSFHPAGHIIGSAQIRLEYKGEVWVASGDYKIENDGLSPAFEPVKCHTFITESTFGLPIYQWNSQQQLFDEINGWWRHNQERDIASVLCAYSLGKAQRILYNLDQSIGPIYLHGTIFNMNKALVNAGMPIPDVPRADTGLKKDAFRKAMIIAPPSAAGSAWLRRFTPVSLGVASGWMAIRGTKRRRAADKGFALSDHADWQGLNDAVKVTGAERIYVTHGYSSQFSRWLCDLGYDAKPVETMFEGESAEILETDQAEEEKLADNPIAEE
jgi:putative mRNA 3-end processing factor